MNDIKIGKNAVENFTVGMYKESKIIFREYIQNATDQIDKALKENMFPGENLTIEITIDPNKRYIQIKDNATGIPQADYARKLSDIADSEKEKGVDKGFRGIGRLGGLAYCQYLRFTTTYKGENTKSVMTWNAEELIRLIEDNTVKDSAEQVIQQVVSYSNEPCDPDSHYFIVELLGVRKENDELLDVEKVREYIASTAPVPYSSKFIFRSKIYEFLDDKNLPHNEYEVYVNDEDVYKDYTTYLFDNTLGQKRKYDEIYDVYIQYFVRDNGEPLAWMWYGISSFEKSIPESVNKMRGIRLRQANIQLGDERALAPFFKESRGYSYFIGEVHAIHKDLIPNARRDYFNENEMRLELEVKLQNYFGETLHKLYYGANKVKNAFKKEINLKQKQIEYNEKQKKGFASANEKEKIENEIEQKEIEYNKAKTEYFGLKSRVKEGEPLQKVVAIIESNFDDRVKEQEQQLIETKHQANKVSKKNPMNRPLLRVDGLYKLNLKQKKLVSRIYDVIDSVLPPDLSESLINKIEDELNK